MRISELINNLKKIKKDNGDIEVTCTASLLKDGHGGVVPDVFESTVENLILKTSCGARSCGVEFWKQFLSGGE